MGRQSYGSPHHPTSKSPPSQLTGHCPPPGRFGLGLHGLAEEAAEQGADGEGADDQELRQEPQQGSNTLEDSGETKRTRVTVLWRVLLAQRPEVFHTLNPKPSLIPHPNWPCSGHQNLPRPRVPSANSRKSPKLTGGLSASDTPRRGRRRRGQRDRLWWIRSRFRSATEYEGTPGGSHDQWHSF